MPSSDGLDNLLGFAHTDLAGEELGKKVVAHVGQRIGLCSRYAQPRVQWPYRHAESLRDGRRRDDERNFAEPALAQLFGCTAPVT